MLMARDSPFAVGSEVDLRALADADWICSRDEIETSDRVLRRACHAVGIKPRVLMRTDDLSMTHGLVAEGLGCTLTTQAALDTRFACWLAPLSVRLPCWSGRCALTVPACRFYL